MPLAGYAEQFLFVLNQVDRLDQAGLEAVLDDLTRRLASEGFDAARIVTTAARPVVGEAQGISLLAEEIGERFEAKQTAQAKLLEDVRRAHGALAEATGVTGRSDSTAREQWETARRGAVVGLADLVSGPDMAEQAERVGERLAVARAAGPPGRLGALLRRSRMGRALGAAPDEVKPGEWWAQPGLERVLGGLSRTVTDVSIDLGGRLGRDMRSALTPKQLETAVRASVEGTRQAVGELDPPAPKRWWGLIGLIQLVLFAVLAVGVAWVWIDGVDRGEFPWNVTLIVGALIVSILLGFSTRASGRRAGRRRAERYRSEVEDGLADQIDERIGTTIEAALASRHRVATALDRLTAALED